MECLYRDYFPTLGQNFPPNENVYCTTRREFDYQQTTNQTRFHPYGRREHSTLPRNYDNNLPYQPYFDSILQLPVYGDVTTDVNTLATGQWYPNNFNYNYPNLNFLQGGTVKPGTERGIGFCGKISPVPTHDLQCQMYPTFGENYGQFQSVNSSKRASASIGQTRTRDKYRIVYTDSQKIALEEEYNKSSFITENRRAELAEEINLSERQIKFWFQNRRVKDRRGGKSAKTHKQHGESSSLSTGTKNKENPADVVKVIQIADTTLSRPQCRFTTNTGPAAQGLEQDITRTNVKARNETQEVATSRVDFGCGHPPSALRHPVSPSEWGTLSESSLLVALNVSPILTSVENNLTTRS